MNGLLRRGWALGAPLVALLTAATALAATTVVGQDPSAVPLAAHIAPPPTPFFVPEPPPLPPGTPLELLTLRGDAPLKVTPFDAAGVPDFEAIAAIEHLFRSARGSEVEVAPDLVALLVRISEAVEGRPIVLVSGHREPGRGTRKTSHHVGGRAADITVRGVPVRELHEIARREGARGLGLYPSFVHIDMREDEPYRWVGGRWPRRPKAAFVRR